MPPCGGSARYLTDARGQFGATAWGEKSLYGKRYLGVIRSSVVIDGRGKVAAVFDKI